MKRIVTLIMALAITLGIVGTIPVTVSAASTYTRSVKDGTYTITSVAYNQYRWNVYAGGNYDGCQLGLWKRDGTKDQQIYVKHQGSGKYLLYAVCTNNKRVIDVYRGNNKKLASGMKLDTWLPNDSLAQLMYIECVGENQYVFRMCSNSNLVVSCEKGSNGSRLVLAKYKAGEKKQIFSFYSSNGKSAVNPVYTEQNSVSNQTGTQKASVYVAAGLENKVKTLKTMFEPGDRKTTMFKSNAWQCHGFACDALMMFWGTSKPTSSNKNYTYYKATASKSYVDKIRPGDMIRYRNGSLDHTIVITNVDDNYVYYADCNGDGKCTFVYDQKMSKSTLDGLLKKVLHDQAISTRGYVCHYVNNDL